MFPPPISHDNGLESENRRQKKLHGELVGSLGRRRNSKDCTLKVQNEHLNHEFWTPLLRTLHTARSLCFPSSVFMKVVVDFRNT